jgi:hypothetical protein
LSGAMEKVVHVPLWLVQLVTGAKSFRDNPIIGSRHLNRLGLHALRRRTADRSSGIFCRVTPADPRQAGMGAQAKSDGTESADRMHAEGSFRISDHDRGMLGLPAPVRMAVPANTLVVADTSGFHARSQSLRPSHRVEIYATFRRSPFLPWTGGHFLSLPPISGRHAAIEMSLQRLFLSTGFGRGSWTIVQGVSPFDPPRL